MRVLGVIMPIEDENTEQSSKGGGSFARYDLLKKPWVWLVGAVAALALLLTNINTILRQSRELPGEVGKTSQQFSSWFYDYPHWPGDWTSFPEGDVDIPDQNLTPEGIRLKLQVENGGQLDGTIETDGICKNVTYFESALIDGKITGAHTAKLAVFNFVEGHRRLMASIKVNRDGDSMTLTPVDDPFQILPASAKIARAPLGIAKGDDLCPGKELTFVQGAIKAISR